MTGMLAIAALLSTQAGIAAQAPEQAIEQLDVGYDELASGKTDLAIARIEAQLQDNPDDPALLINLGSAWASKGEFEKAAEFYNRAARSDVRYRMELADGNWVDSRRAARLALANMEEQRLAMR